MKKVPIPLPAGDPGRDIASLLTYVQNRDARPGFTGTVPLAKLTAGGTAGSLSLEDGRITAVTAPT